MYKVIDRYCKSGRDDEIKDKLNAAINALKITDDEALKRDLNKTIRFFKDELNARKQLLLQIK